ncbi:MAG: hypothetical protein EB127_05775 [Alphaproteobacteria bacterium]|nr:hypothetical protein [Alphaproteobacteria bacterium]
MNSLQVYPLPASDGSHHIDDSRKPAYSKRFKEVGKFHTPGLAPVLDESGWYHILPNGKPAYKERYEKVWGFYCGRAAAKDSSGWMHISKNGKPIYKERYQWVGNFQEDACVVQTKEGFYHIGINGKTLYDKIYSYAGDFKDNVAVAWTRKNNTCRYINKEGVFLNRNAYSYLGLIHKNYACARDSIGWMHIKRNGLKAYHNYFEFIEDFYNGLAVVKTYKGEYLRINECGETIDKFESGFKKRGIKIVVTGNIGSGKTTLRNKIQKLTGWKAYGIDDMRKHFGDKTPAGEARSWAAFLNVAQSCNNSIIEYTGCGPNSHLVNEALRQSQSRIYYIAVSSKISDCLKRISNRKWDVPYPFNKLPDKNLLGRIHQELKVEWKKRDYIYFNKNSKLTQILKNIKNDNI